MNANRKLVHTRADERYWQQKQAILPLLQACALAVYNMLNLPNWVYNGRVASKKC